MTMVMIDEASYQAHAWTAAALRAAGILVAAVKCTEGTGYVNPDYGWQVGECRGAGVVVIHYHLARYGQAVTEAQYFHASSDVRQGELVMLDNEAALITALPSASASAWVADWGGEVKGLTRAPAVVEYTSTGPVAGGYLDSVKGKEPLFAAILGADPAVQPPPVDGWMVSFLQYGVRPSPGGGQTDADSAFFVTMAELAKLAVPAAGPVRHVAGAGLPSLEAVAAQAGTTAAAITAESEVKLSPLNLAVFRAYLALAAAMGAAGMPAPGVPEGMVYWTP